MANRNVKVIGHWQDSSSGKNLLHYGTALQKSMNVATQIGPDGQERLDPVAVQNKLSAAGLVPTGATWITTSYQLLDSYEVANGIL
jgi:hypothetical protein